MITDALKLYAGRWLDRNLPPVEPVPSSLPMWDVEPPHSTPRPACTLMRGEHVLVDGRWCVIDRAECVRPSQGPSQTRLHLVGGAIATTRFDYVYMSRDREEQSASMLFGAEVLDDAQL